MGIKTILTLFAVGGIAGAAFYFRDGITDAFASGKETIIHAKDTLQEGAGGNNNQEIVSTSDNNKPVDVKNENPQYIYVPIYQNDGQQSVQKGQESVNNNQQNPTLTQYITQDKEKTESSISEFSSLWARENPTEYAEQKYGIDYELLESAVTKTPDKRTVDEKKEIEEAKAREIFDSRSINNW